jgi:adenosylcobyric acid synthase
MRGALLVAGTTSDAGKSLLVAGLCRSLARRGVKVAPFKAQNMSNNSAVTPDGAEIGRAQALQAYAAGVAPEAAMNPVLLKPGSDRTSHVVVLGRPYADVSAVSYREHKAHLLDVALDALTDLRSRFDVVLCEGAGSPAEINLRATDIANMGLARAAGLPVVVVGDIDRGGVFAALYGTLALLSREDQALVSGFVVNKFRGDPALLAPGLASLRELTGRPVLGVLPWLDGMAFDVEDSLALDGPAHAVAPPIGADLLRVGVVRLPRISNFTDVEALAGEPGVSVRYVTTPVEAADVDLLVVPGSRATVSDLGWLRARGLDEVVRRRAAAGRPVLAICGGFQMLGTAVVDDVESRQGAVEGIGVLPVRTTFAPGKTLARPHGRAYGEEVTAYEIHHGVVTVEGGEPFLDGCRVRATWGTLWHGALENDGFRRAFLRDVAARAGRTGFVVADDTSFTRLRDERLDRLSDAVDEHLDTAAISALIERGPSPALPFVPPGAPGAPHSV